MSTDICRHGLAGPCPDCPPGRIGTSTNDDVAAPWAAVMRKREGPWVVVKRQKANGSLDWFTWHLTRRGARRAVDAYRRNGTVKGIRP